MSEDKKVNITETDEALEITINWFSPVAYFLAFFSVFWCGALVVWYSIAITTGAPLMAMIFPLIHVAIGISILYYTVCLFFNKTYMDVYKGHLTVYHKPIPWWKGSKEIPTKNIKQFYVNKKVKTKKSGTQSTYELMVKTVNNSNKTLLSLDGITRKQVQELENRLEAYIGIEDYPVSGEYHKRKDWWGNAENIADKKEPRRHRRDFVDSILALIFHTKERSFISYKNTAFKVANIAQYDWADGNSDKQLQLIDDQNNDSLLYLIQNKALLDVYQEKVLPFFEMTDIKFYKRTPPKSITHKKAIYTLSTFKTGHQFVNLSDEEHSAMKQWIYQSADNQKYLRIIDQEETLTFFEGTQQNTSDFEDKLDLDSVPEKEIEIRANDWDQKDLV